MPFVSYSNAPPSIRKPPIIEVVAFLFEVVVIEMMGNPRAAVEVAIAHDPAVLSGIVEVEDLLKASVREPADDDPNPK